MTAGHPDGEFFDTLCRGNAAARDFSMQVQAWFHALDDVIDADTAFYGVDLAHPARRARLVQVFASGIVILSHPFYLANLAALRMSLLQVATLYNLSLEWQGTPDWRGRWADVQRHAGGQVLLAVAFIVGGWEHAQAMARLMAERSSKI